MQTRRMSRAVHDHGERRDCERQRLAARREVFRLVLRVSVSCFALCPFTLQVIFGLAVECSIKLTDIDALIDTLVFDSSSCFRPKSSLSHVQFLCFVSDKTVCAYCSILCQGR